MEDEALSDGEWSMDEEEIEENFDEVAKSIIKDVTLPKKSADRYLLVYQAYKKWKVENHHLLSAEKNEENNLLIYFTKLKEKLSPPTLWSIYSMLKSTLRSHENIEMKNFLNLQALIKNNSKGYRSKQSLVFSWDNIMRFMSEASDNMYLAAKVILIFGICGALRCEEAVKLEVKDVEKLPNNRFLVSIGKNKNNNPGQFLVGELFYNKVEEYIALRPSEQFSDRFFIQYRNGRCTHQNIGYHTIRTMPTKIATFLDLESPKKYTGHCFRRTAATILSESGAPMQQIKELGRWRSDAIAQLYIQNSIRSKELIFKGITHLNNPGHTLNHVLPIPSTSSATIFKGITHLNNPGHALNNVSSIPSTSSATIIPSNCSNELMQELDLEGFDFSEDFTTTNYLEPTSSTLNTKKTFNPVNTFVTSSLSNTNKTAFQPLDFNYSTAKTISNNNLNFSTARSYTRPHPPQTLNTTKTSLRSNPNRLFSLKPPVKLQFNDSSNNQVMNKKRRTSFDDSHFQNNNQNNQNSVNSTLSQHDLKFENCTYNNCNFYITPCGCKNEENNNN